MHYSLQEGMQDSWSDRLRSATGQLTAHNWLPAGVAALVVLWIGLIVVAMQQVIPLDPGTPSDLTATRNNPPMTVSAAADTPTDLSVNTAGNSSSTQNLVLANVTADTSTNSTLPGTPTSPIASLTDPIIGGRGADETPATETPSIETPSVPDVPVPAVELEVETPLTPEPIELDIDTDNGLQTGINLGGILDVDLDLGLGL